MARARALKKDGDFPSSQRVDRPEASGQELTAKHTAQGTNGKKEIAGRGDPASAVRR
jgi:hypothetical protein